MLGLLLAACRSSTPTTPPTWGGFAADPVQLELPPPATTAYAWFDAASGTRTGPCEDGRQGELRYTLEPPGDGSGSVLTARRSTCVADTIGVTHWELTPFVRGAPLTVESWTLPPADAPGWPTASGEATESCADGAVGTRAWSTLDLDGDGVEDLVRTVDGCVSDEVGRARWEVHLGGPGGYADTTEAWALPAVAVGLAHPWAALTGEDTWGCPDGTYGTLGHAVRDLTGDGVPDLVVTRDDCGDPAVGEDHWNVYRGATDGFAATPTAWPIPLRRGGRPWWTIDGYAGASCLVEVEGAHREVRDLDADGLADLLVTWDACDEAWDPDAWLLYPGTGAGFATSPVTWPLPPAGSGWARSTGADPEAVCADGVQGSRQWVLDDIDGNGQDDSVVTYDGCDPLLETWRVYRGAAEGFDLDAVPWQLPGGAVRDVPKWDQYTGPGGTAPCLVGGWGDLDAEVLDVDGDEVRDLLVTRDACSDPTAGFDHWRVFYGALGG